MSSRGVPEKYRVLVVDDEQDIHAVTKLSLKGLKHAGRGVELLSAASGKEALELLRANPDVAVMLLDVVMESDSAGLEACKAIRNELGNRFVRILLRTGQPGAAPERQTIDDYDIDGYLPKAEISATKLYSSVRTALRAYAELVELERHRQHLAAMHDCVAALHSFAPLKDTLQRVLGTVVAICPAPLAVLLLETFESQGNPKRYFLHLSTEADPATARTSAEAVRSAVLGADRADANSRASLRSDAPGGDAPRAVAGGLLVPLVVHRELGHGWIWVAEPEPDAVVQRILPMLAAHASNALYSSIAETMLAAREGPLFDAMPI